jgi:hypothetical protein
MPRELSGMRWVSRFPTSTSLDDLKGNFRQNAHAFVGALRAAGATVTIAATYRPAERAYLMHYCFRIAKGGLDPQRVPAYPGVDIEWAHRDQAGQVDVARSRQAAREMAAAYAIVRQPALASRHTQGLAIDMRIAWTGTLRLLTEDGTEVAIQSEPRSGNNAELHKVGETYGCFHRVPKDPPHWSSDGR